MYFQSSSPFRSPYSSSSHPQPSQPLTPELQPTDLAVSSSEHRSNEPDACPLSPYDLSLLARWCATTYRSLSLDDRNGKVWMIVIVQKAMRHPALLDSILALSALDMAHHFERDYIEEHQQNRQQLQRLANVHYDRARIELDDQVNQPVLDLSHRDSNALFAVCSMLMVFAFGSIQSHRSSNASALADLCQIFHQMRGSPEILVSLVDQVGQGELACLIRSGETSPIMPNTFTLAIHALRKVNYANPEGNYDTGTRLIYNKAIDCLASSLRYTAWSSLPGLVEVSWLLEIPEEFMGLALDHQPIALTILAHYCVILYHLRAQWWMGDFGIKVLKEIGLLLGRDRVCSIQWAIDATGINLATSFV